MPEFNARSLLKFDNSRVAVITENGEHYSYEDLLRYSDKLSSCLKRKSLIFNFCELSQIWKGTSARAIKIVIADKAIAAQPEILNESIIDGLTASPASSRTSCCCDISNTIAKLSINKTFASAFANSTRPLTPNIRFKPAPRLIRLALGAKDFGLHNHPPNANGPNTAATASTENNGNKEVNASANECVK